MLQNAQANRYDSATRLHRLVSIHDVMPETFDAVDECLTTCEGLGVGPVYLLVVPGKNWQPSQLQKLQEYTHRGHHLVGHGWSHNVDKIQGLKHWLHSILISRRAAEHLQHTADVNQQLMRNCYQWFIKNDLPKPTLYVPPAWAIGDISLGDLADTGFSLLEVQRGIIDLNTLSLVKLPLLGFEADTGFRRYFLKCWNKTNRLYEIKSNKTLRLSIHPYDLHLKLRNDLLIELRNTHAIDLVTAMNKAGNNVSKNLKPIC